MLAYPIQSIQIGGKVFDSSYAFPCHVHAWHQFYCVLKGRIAMRVNGKTCLLRSGSAIWLAPSLRREPRAASDSGQYLNITFRSPWPDLGSGSGEQILLDRISLAEAWKCAGLSAAGAHEQSIAFHSLCFSLFGPSRFSLLPAGSQAGKERDSWLVSKVETLMCANISAPLGLEELASLARVSRATLGRVFRRYRKMSPISRFREIRLEHALQLLRTTRLSVTEVAFQTGFSSSQHFSTCFKRKFCKVPGKVPREQILYINGAASERDGPEIRA